VHIGRRVVIDVVNADDVSVREILPEDWLREVLGRDGPGQQQGCRGGQCKSLTSIPLRRESKCKSI
jgi:hypothetical protein